jgi:DNA repair photolyase
MFLINIFNKIDEIHEISTKYKFYRQIALLKNLIKKKAIRLSITFESIY